ncbi:MAG: squalene--hopene cyclase [Actinobacteria bacterium]|nr:squalene--hopene cyclase [Actinomycetota bacterium]
MSGLLEQTTLRREAEAALTAAVGHLRDLQSPEGWWKGELETNITMEAEDLLLRAFLGIADPEITRKTAKWIRSKQLEDGTWAIFHGGPSDLSATIEAYVALRLAGDATDAPHMRAAAQFVRDRGGVERARVFTKIWLSLFGLWSWDHVPAMPPELIFLPRWFPLNLYDFACWARQTVAALTVVSAYRPVRPIGIAIDELRVGGPPLHRRKITDPWGRAFLRLDRVLHRYERRPVRRLREAALARMERWILERQEADGGWGGIQPPWVYSIMALSLRGYALDHPAIEKALRGLEGFTITEGDVRRLEACQSPVWDTALAVVALGDAGALPSDPAIARAAGWLLGEEVGHRGDWAIRRPEIPTGGWAFEFANDWYPDIDDTTEVALALRRAEASPALDAAVARGVEWTIGMRSKDGAWGAFDADNVRALVRRLPFCDFGEVIDPPSADVTAHVVEMLAHEGRADDPITREAVDWLLREQEPEGSWFGRWGANHLYGTGAVVPALVAARVPREHAAVRRAVAWLENVQNLDGGWGEDLRSYQTRRWRGVGASTPSQTAWALLALHAAGERSDAVRRGVAWLVDNQLPDGTWDEPYFTGTGFPGDFYINYHLYRLVFPVTALGRLVRGEML